MLSSVDEEGKGTILATNRSTQPVRFMVMQITSKDGKSSTTIPKQFLTFECEPNSGSIPPFRSARLRLRVLCRLPGQHTVDCVLRDLNSKSDVPFSVRISVPSPRLIEFAGLRPDRTLDFGLCYLTAGDGFTKVESFQITSLSERELEVSGSSNLSSQVQLFSDAQLHTPLKNISLPARGKLDVFVGLQPNMRDNALASGHTRSIEGGIHLRVCEQGHEMLTVTVKLAARVGVSELKLSKKFHKLGSTTQLGHEFSAPIRVLNISSELPLHFTLEPPADVCCSVMQGVVPPDSHFDLTLTMRSACYGLSQRKVS